MSNFTDGGLKRYILFLYFKVIPVYDKGLNQEKKSLIIKMGVKIRLLVLL